MELATTFHPWLRPFSSVVIQFLFSLVKWSDNDSKHVYISGLEVKRSNTCSKTWSQHRQWWTTIWEWVVHPSSSSSHPHTYLLHSSLLFGMEMKEMIWSSNLAKHYHFIPFLHLSFSPSHSYYIFFFSPFFQSLSCLSFETGTKFWWTQKMFTSNLMTCNFLLESIDGAESVCIWNERQETLWMRIESSQSSSFDFRILVSSNLFSLFSLSPPFSETSLLLFSSIQRLLLLPPFFQKMGWNRWQGSIVISLDMVMSYNGTLECITICIPPSLSIPFICIIFIKFLLLSRNLSREKLSGRHYKIGLCICNAREGGNERVRVRERERVKKSMKK